MEDKEIDQKPEMTDEELAEKEMLEKLHRETDMLSELQDMGLGHKTENDEEFKKLDKKASQKLDKGYKKAMSSKTLHIGSALLALAVVYAGTDFSDFTFIDGLFALGFFAFLYGVFYLYTFSMAIDLEQTKYFIKRAKNVQKTMTEDEKLEAKKKAKRQWAMFFKWYFISEITIYSLLLILFPVPNRTIKDIIEGFLLFNIVMPMAAGTLSIVYLLIMYIVKVDLKRK